METRANYIIIGAFTVAGFLGILGFFMWFTKSEMDQQFAYYDTRFENVSGLGRASDVRFAGLTVGQVVDLGLSESGDGTVRVRLEVAANTPIRVDSIARVESQGVTGVAFVAITSGSTDAPLLKDQDDKVPEITSERSVLQTLAEDAPALFSEALEAVRALQGFLSDDNKRQVGEIIGNLASTSQNLNSTLDDFSSVAAKVGDSIGDIEGFTQQLDGIGKTVDEALAMAESAIVSITEMSDQARETLVTGSQTLESATGAFDVATNVLDTDVRTTLRELEATAATLRGQTETLGTTAENLMVLWSETGQTANSRLQEAETTLARLNTTLESVEGAADQAGILLSGDGARLVAQATEAVAGIARAVEDDLPVVMADIRAATQTARVTMETVGGDLSAASGRIDGLSDDARTTLTTVTDTFSRAQTTLAAMDSALETGQGALSAAERAFNGADKVINEDIEGITTDLRAAIRRLDGALAQVSSDLPEISAGVREAAEAARSAFTGVDAMVADAKPPVADFLSSGLPQYSLLGAEARKLVQTLDTLADRIERDPARFFLSRDVPEYRR
ncbi:phospholipid/cholesterol/gamma-HCH transport system substrate-binding protein [Rhodovulum imhoffii]|uniref:Phospholipid/cholesterol/gamma-HCH transport system substrate-binding protein n=1 Tax=Rhodovulum imhoffii TaxID=365340 RepID=A0A2T5BVM3_9RHOB|nr:MlaD family protein [Rhodovulum imhoffii]MBK5932831.1 hypothetical protein [Rhodovulum imhoffii]PTN03600.1 phospholipid/cholesterol/gamma-HCH transport system substrate-binding protein [Rhodovulum imhoffii]